MNKLRSILFILGLLVIAGGVWKNQPAEPAAAQMGGAMQSEEIVVTGTGSDGAATGSTRSSATIAGHIFAVHLDFPSNVTNTTDITISGASPALTIMALTNYYTDTWFYPEVQGTDSAGAAISGAYDRLPVDDRLTVSAAQSMSQTVVTATVYWGE